MKKEVLEVMAGDDPTLIAALEELQREAVPPRLRYPDPREYFREALTGDANINIIAQDEKRLLVGYLLGIPHSRVFQELRQWDPDIRDDPEKLYLDTVLVLPAARGRNLGYRLVQKVCREAEKRNFFKLSMHARTINGWSRYLQKIFSEVRVLREIDDWFGFGEPFAYLEATTELNCPGKPGK